MACFPYLCCKIAKTQKSGEFTSTVLKINLISGWHSTGLCTQFIISSTQNGPVLKISLTSGWHGTGL